MINIKKTQEKYLDFIKEKINQRLKHYRKKPNLDVYMPRREIHTKWAEKLGIPREISDYVNRLIETPGKCQEFVEFCDREDEKSRTGKRRCVVTIPYRMLVGKRSSGRRKIVTYLLLGFLRQKGSEYIKAWYLHQILNYIEKAPSLDITAVSYTHLTLPTN